MTPEEMIETFGIRLQGRGQIGLMRNTAQAKTMLAEISAAKSQIIAILEARAAAELAAQEAAQAARIAQSAERRAELEAGAPFAIVYHDGEYLSGYRVSGADAAMLSELGLARYVEGWGYRVDPAAVDALGTTFTLAEARSYMDPVAAYDEEQDRALAAAQAQAKASGEKVVLERWTEGCDGRVPECSLDECTAWVFPDGHVGVERIHTH